MLDSDELRDIYRRLWTLTREGKPRVRVNYMPQGPRMDGRAGYFFPGPPPGIWVVRSREVLPARNTWREPDLDGATLEELISLAHERGHELSFHRGIYRAHSMPEERRAWDHATEILEPMGFTEWDAFAEAKEGSLAEHRRRGTPE